MPAVTNSLLTYCSPDRLNNACAPKDQLDRDWGVLAKQQFIKDHPTDKNGRAFAVKGRNDDLETGYYIDLDGTDYPLTLYLWVKFNGLDNDGQGLKIDIRINDNVFTIHGYNSYGDKVVNFNLTDSYGTDNPVTPVPPYAPVADKWNLIALEFADRNTAYLYYLSRDHGMQTATIDGGELGVDFGDFSTLELTSVIASYPKNADSTEVVALTTDFRYVAGYYDSDYYTAISEGKEDRLVDIPAKCLAVSEKKYRPIIVPTDEVKYKLANILKDGDKKTHKAVKPKMLAPRSPVEVLTLADIKEKPGIFSYKDIEAMQDKVGFYVDNLINNALHVKIKDHEHGVKALNCPMELSLSLKSVDLLYLYKDVILSACEVKE